MRNIFSLTFYLLTITSYLKSPPALLCAEIFILLIIIFRATTQCRPYDTPIKFCVFTDSRKGCPYGTRRKNNIFGYGRSPSLIPNYLRNADDSVSEKSRYSLTVSALYKQKEKVPGRFLPRTYYMINVYQTTRGSAKRMSGKGH